VTTPTVPPRSPVYQLPDPPERPEDQRAGLFEWVALAAVAITVIVADQITKSIATRTLVLERPVRLAPFFDLTRIHNPGIAFGQFTGRQPIVMILVLVAVGWMTVFFARSGGRHPLFPVAMGLLVGGALSNFADRVRAGFVTDFLHIHHWPIFNLADSCIVIGVCLLLIGLSAVERRAHRTPPPAP
jgi:signal peptidase II